MRFSFLSALAIGFLFAVSACGGSTPHKNGQNASGHEDVLLRLAHAAESAGDLPHAEALYKQAIKESDNSVQMRLELAEFYKRTNQNQQAMEMLSNVLQERPTDTGILRELANIHLNLGEPDQALVLLDRAIAHNPKDAFLFSSRGVALDMQARYKEAQKSYRTALILDPSQDVTFKTNLSMSYILDGSYNKAIDLLLPMLGTASATPTVRQNLALAYGLKGESSEALKLGLQDLTQTQAEENLKFYRAIAKSQGNVKPDAKLSSRTAPEGKAPENPFIESDDSAVPVSDLPVPPPAPKAKPVVVVRKSPMPMPHKARPAAKPENDEDDDDDAQQDIPAPTVKAVPVKTVSVHEAPPPPAAEESVSAGGKADETGLPTPSLKPDRF